MSDLSKLSFKLRKQVVEMIYKAKTGHIGGDMSVMEILVALYFSVMNIGPSNQNDENRDLFVLSKGHCVEALYTVLAEKGFLDINDVINNYSTFGSKYIGHPNNKLPGIEMNSGSLGHGLPVAVGMAIASKMDKRKNRVYVVMGDGELAEGSIWEAAMSATHYKLDNLCAIVDRNHLQISGPTEEVMHEDIVSERFKSFGWNAIEVKNGNSIDELLEAFDLAKKCSGKPTIIVANTIKGYGSAIMENKAEWHHKVPTENEYAEIIKDLSAKMEG